MDTLTAIEQRRSVKHYDPNHQMPDADVDRLMDLALLSPTSFNIQNWRFVLIRDPELRQQVQAHAWGQAQVSDASLLVVLCADVLAWDRDAARYWRSAPEEVQQQLVPAIGNFYRGKDQLQRDEAIRSIGIAAQTLMLAAKAMGYDSSPMIGFDPEAVAKLIDLPDDHVVGLLLAIGKQVRPARPRGGQLPKDEVVFIDRFPA